MINTIIVIIITITLIISIIITIIMINTIAITIIINNTITITLIISIIITIIINTITITIIIINTITITIIISIIITIIFIITITIIIIIIIIIITINTIILISAFFSDLWNQVIISEVAICLVFQKNGTPLIVTLQHATNFFHEIRDHDSLPKGLLFEHLLGSICPVRWLIRIGIKSGFIMEDSDYWSNGWVRRRRVICPHPTFQRFQPVKIELPVSNNIRPFVPIKVYALGMVLIWEPKFMQPNRDSWLAHIYLVVIFEPAYNIIQSEIRTSPHVCCVTHKLPNFSHEIFIKGQRCPLWMFSSSWLQLMLYPLICRFINRRYQGKEVNIDIRCPPMDHFPTESSGFWGQLARLCDAHLCGHTSTNYLKSYSFLYSQSCVSFHKRL